MKDKLELSDIMKQNRREEMKAVMRLIASCNCTELAKIVEEIRCVHNNLVCFDQNTKSLCIVESICLNGEDIQMNTEMTTHKNFFISVSWNVDDVLSLDDSLTFEECQQVLVDAHENHDANVGINWDILRHYITQRKR